MAVRVTFTKERAEKRQILADTFPLTGNVRAKQFAAYLGIGESTLWAHVKSGKIKQPTKLSVRTSTWSAKYARDLAENGIPEANQEAA